MASSYGWAKKDILETIYIDEVAHYQKIIARRIRYDRMYQLRIAHNPHLKPADQKTLVNELSKEPGDAERPDKLDKASFELLRGQLSANTQSKFNVK